MKDKAIRACARMSACATAVSLALGTIPAFAGEGTNLQETAGSSIKPPAVEAGAYYRSMKIERGMVENKESVFGYGAEIEWFGFFGGVEACHDMTGTGRRKGRYNEIESSAGYGFSLGALTAKAAYVYKACGGEEHDTQEIEAGLEYETPYATPFLECELDIDDSRGALYGAFGMKREWELAGRVGLCACAGIGFGNAKRNRADFDAGRCAFRDMHAGLELEIELAPHVKLVPGVDLYDQFTSAGRHEYRKGFAAAGGVRLEVEF